MAKYEIMDPRLTLEPGEYYIGDPCYVIPDSEWSDALDATRFFNLFPKSGLRGGEYNPKDLQNGVFARNGVPFAVSTTAYGDGEYPCRYRGEEVGRCCVDAGMIAAIPVSMIDMAEFKKSYGDRGLDDLGCVVDIDEFRVEYDDGTIRFGDIEVETDDDEEGEYY